MQHVNETNCCQSAKASCDMRQETYQRSYSEVVIQRKAVSHNLGPGAEGHEGEWQYHEGHRQAYHAAFGVVVLHVAREVAEPTLVLQLVSTAS